MQQVNKVNCDVYTVVNKELYLDLKNTELQLEWSALDRCLVSIYCTVLVLQLLAVNPPIKDQGSNTLKFLDAV